MVGYPRTATVLCDGVEEGRNGARENMGRAVGLGKDFRFCYIMLKGFEKEGYSYERLILTGACWETRPWEGKGKRGRGVPLQ